ncbi:MAG: hypothetical protein WCF18_06775 [Chthoniobacteraceae bacterium]
MRSFVPRPRALALLTFFSLLASAWCDPVIPGNILNPKSAAEAWNVIRLATKNVDQLLEENRLEEIPVQISYCSPALRTLPGVAREPDQFNAVQTLGTRAFVSVNAVAISAQQKNPVGAKSALTSLRALLESMAQYFDAKVVSADIFYCPMHPDFLAENAMTPCAKCGMSLVPRGIPYSFIYTKPGEPTVHLTAIASGPVEAGKKIDVKVRMERADNSPVLPADLLVMHTQPIHLLIEEAGLGDYHHEHPILTEKPGEYAFSFTPGKTTAYRVWADIVPAATGVQELPFVDLASTGKASSIEDTASRFTSSAGGYQFTLLLANGNHVPPKAGQSRQIGITVTDPNGKPVTELEPVMNAFSHLVGFYDDYKTVIHLHPTGGDVLNPTLRGGPALGFILFAPRPGFVRLYCQVRIGGKMLFAPFNLNVEP